MKIFISYFIRKDDNRGEVSKVKKKKRNELSHDYNAPHAKCKLPLHLWLNFSFVNFNIFIMQAYLQY